MRPMDLYDISVILGAKTAVYPGDAPYTRVQEVEGHFSLSTISLCVHSGTHIDAPAHLIDGGRTIDSYPPERFILPATVIEVEGKGAVGPGSLEGREVERGSAVLFKTENSKRGLLTRGGISDDYVYLSLEAALECIDAGASLVGIDCLSVDKPEDLSCHRALLSSDVLIMESINLSAAPVGEYTLVCLPLRLEGSEAAPTRAVLMR